MKSKWLFFLFFSFLTTQTLANSEADSLLSLAKEYRKNKDWDNALKTANEALQSAEKTGNLSVYAEAKNIMGYVCFKKGDYKEGLKQYNDLLDARLKMGNDTLIAQAHFNIGLSYKQIGAYDRALDRYRIALKMFENLNDEEALSKVYNAIGNIENNSGNYLEAIAYFKDAILIRKKHGDPAALARSFLNLGQTFNDSTAFEKARPYLYQSKSLKLKIGENTAGVHSQLGYSYLGTSLLDSADYFLFLALSQRKQNNDSVDFAINYKHLSNLFIAKEDYQTALHYNDSAYQMAKMYQLDNELIEITNQKIDLYKLLDLAVKTPPLYEELLQLNEKVNSRDSKLNLELIEALDELIKSQKQVTLKNERLVLQRAENEKLDTRNKFLFILVLVALFFILAISFTLWRLKRSKKETEIKNTLLNESNQKIDALHKELSHRTKNYYQMFSGILKHDRKNATDKNTDKLLESYIGRVEAMAQIQRYLTISEGATHEVQIDLYLDELLANIGLALNHTGVVIEHQFETLSVDYDKALRLGLVMNEIVNNALEHGFDGVKNPEIKLVLLKDERSIINLTIADNGVGLSETAQTKKDAKGLGLIEKMLHPLGAEIHYSSISERGTSIRIHVPD